TGRDDPRPEWNTETPARLGSTGTGALARDAHDGRRSRRGGVAAAGRRASPAVHRPHRVAPLRLPDGLQRGGEGRRPVALPPAAAGVGTGGATPPLLGPWLLQGVDPRHVVPRGQRADPAAALGRGTLARAGRRRGWGRTSAGRLPGHGAGRRVPAVLVRRVRRHGRPPGVVAVVGRRQRRAP